MNSEDSLKTLIDRHLPTPSPLELTASHDRLLRELRSTPPHLLRPRIADAAPSISWWRPVVSLTAAAALIAIVATVSFERGDFIATVEAADGSHYTLEPNEVLRLRDGNAMLRLADGSSVEARSQAELSLEREGDGLGIRLRSGDIIVDAAEQGGRRLHVHTKDMTVAVAGTVFLVNAGADGSRVAVIEGEVEVREGTHETTLKPGEQVATSPTLAVRSMRDDLTWSRHAAAHLAQLAMFQRGIANTAGRLEPLNQSAQGGGAPAAPAFEEASIRACDLDNLPPLPAGARGGGANSFFMTPGRTYALCMTVATLVRTAYGYGPMNLDHMMAPGGRGFGPLGRGLSFNAVFGLGMEDGRRVRGGPGWVRTEPFTIEAVADGPADAETMRGPMLKALLESRFKLKAHVETEQVPAFTLTIAPGGLKMKPVQASGITPEGFVATTVTSDACEPGPPMNVPAVRIPRTFAEVRSGAKPSCGAAQSLNGPNYVVVGGAAGMPALARLLGTRLGNVRVIDKTGTTELFNFILEFVIDENTPGEVFVRQMADDPASVPPGQTIFAALEDQLGLKLEPTRAPREFLVIDAIERPSAN
jgi:uncharacterized protein (TIGR03435 family)